MSESLGTFYVKAIFRELRLFTYKPMAYLILHKLIKRILLIWNLKDQENNRM